MKKGMENAEISRKVRKPEEIFKDEWITRVRKGLEEFEKLDDEKPDIMKKGFRTMFFYRCMADLAFEYATPTLLGRIVRDTEAVCNRVGVSLLDRPEVSRCLPSKHEECMGSYYSPFADRTIICKCECHS